MSDTKRAAHAGPGDARVIEEHPPAGPPGQDVIDAIDHRGRRRYYLWPPGCRTAAGNSVSTWWMQLVWLIAIVLIGFPFPKWW